MSWSDDMVAAQDKTFAWIRAGNCGCARCLREQSLSRAHMILCPTCGNKRCPHASDHRYACTHSNEPGQPGSAYA